MVPFFSYRASNFIQKKLDRCGEEVVSHEQNIELENSFSKLRQSALWQSLDVEMKRFYSIREKKEGSSDTASIDSGIFPDIKLLQKTLQSVPVVWSNHYSLFFETVSLLIEYDIIV